MLPSRREPANTPSCRGRLRRRPCASATHERAGRRPEKTMTVVLTLAEIYDLSAAALVGSGTSVANADPVGRSIQDAEAEGFPNGGLTYLLHYCQHLRSGRVDGRAVPIVRVEAPSVIQVDAANGFCHAAFTMVEDQFVALTRQAG